MEKTCLTSYSDPAFEMFSTFWKNDDFIINYVLGDHPWRRERWFLP